MLKKSSLYIKLLLVTCGGGYKLSADNQLLEEGLMMPNSIHVFMYSIMCNSQALLWGNTGVRDYIGGPVVVVM